MRKIRSLLLLSLILRTAFTDTQSEDTHSPIYASGQQIPSEIANQTFVQKIETSAENKTVKHPTLPVDTPTKHVPAFNSQVTQGNQIRLVKPISVTESAYTITADDFVEKTSLATLNKNEKEKINSKATEKLESINNESEGFITNNKPEGNSTNLKLDTEDDVAVPPKFSNLTSINENYNLGNSSNKNISDQVTLIDKSKELSSRLKSFDDNLTTLWEKRKTEVNKASEALNVLENYREKISISESVNLTDCVRSDLEHYKTRMDSLKEVFGVCDLNLEKEDWNQLKKRCKELLLKINATVREATDSKDRLSKASEDFGEKISAIEKEGIAKLANLYLDDIMEKYVEVETKSLPDYENNYKKCIEDRTQKEMVVDTLNDIMRIKNNCVG